MVLTIAAYAFAMSGVRPLSRHRRRPPRPRRGPGHRRVAAGSGPTRRPAWRVSRVNDTEHAARQRRELRGSCRLARHPRSRSPADATAGPSRPGDAANAAEPGAAVLRRRVRPRWSDPCSPTARKPDHGSVGRVAAHELSRRELDASLRVRLQANRLVLNTYRNGPIEDLHGGMWSLGDQTPDVRKIYALRSRASPTDGRAYGGRTWDVRRPFT
jgi:hypothetical protein